MAPLLSIVIPTYNGENHLGGCLDCVLAQTLPQDEYEIVVVDDKSADNTLALAREYEKAHGNIRVIALPERTPGGPGFPSNMGIRAARGKYLAFLDHDDAACPEMFAKLVTAAEAEKADITFCSFSMRAKGETALLPPYDTEYWEELFTPAFAALPFAEQKKQYLKISPVPWRKVHNREFLRRNAVFFPVADHFFEDMAFHWRAVIPARKFAAIKDRLIVYTVDRPGQVTSMALEQSVAHQTYQLQAIKDFLLQSGVYAAYGDVFLHAAADVLSRVPETHPKYTELKNAIVALCDGA